MHISMNFRISALLRSHLLHSAMCGPRIMYVVDDSAKLVAQKLHFKEPNTCVTREF